jgi:anti-anti-sigma factor
MKAHTDGPIVVRVAPIVHATEQLKNLIAEEVDSDVVLDVSDLGFATSMLLNELLELRASVLNHGHRIIICCVDERVRGILGVTGLDDVFAITASQTEALSILDEAKQEQAGDPPQK